MAYKGRDATQLDAVKRLATIHGARTRAWCAEHDFHLGGEALRYALWLEHAWWIRPAVGIVFTALATWLFTKLG